MKPINPQEVNALADKRIPDYAVQAFNELIVENWTGRSSTIKQDKVIERMLSIALNQEIYLTRDKIFQDKSLDVEKLFENEGWVVSYDKPGYNETYSAYFIFTKP